MGYVVESDAISSRYGASAPVRLTAPTPAGHARAVSPLRRSARLHVAVWKAGIKVGEDYALREGRDRGAPLQHVRILQHVRGNKWKAQWIEPNPGLVDYIESRSLVVRWKDRKAFLADEEREQSLREHNERQGGRDDSPVATALTSVFEAASDGLTFHKGVLPGDRRRRLALLQDQLDRVGLEVRRKPPPLSSLHGHILPRSGGVHRIGGSLETSGGAVRAFGCVGIARGAGASGGAGWRSNVPPQASHAHRPRACSRASR